MNEELKKELERINAIPERWELGNTGYYLVHHREFTRDDNYQLSNGERSDLLTEAEALERLKLL